MIAFLMAKLGSGSRLMWANGLLGLFLLTAVGGARAEFLLLTRTTLPDGVPGQEVLGWASAEAFVAGASARTVYGSRRGAAEIEMRGVATTLGGELVTVQAATGTNDVVDAVRWRDPLRFAANEGLLLGTRYSIGQTVALAADASGRFYHIEQVGGTAGARSYRVRRWANETELASFQAATVLGTAAGMPDLAGLDFADGVLYGLVPVTVSGAAGYELRRWPDMAGFLSGPGTVVGRRAFSKQVIDLFSEWKAAPPTQASAQRAPMWPWLGNKMPMNAPGQPGELTVVEAFPNVRFQNPVQMRPRPGRVGELWVAGREGHLWSVQNNAAVTSKTQILNLTDSTLGWGDSGLLSFVFHPEFGQAGSPNRGFVYLAYSYVPPGTGDSGGRSFNRLSRFTLLDGETTIRRTSELVLIQQYDRHPWHNQGDLFFGEDGFLYFSVGDEGGLDNVYGNAQRLNGGLFSGVLRLDVDRNPARSHPIRRQPLAAEAPPTGWPGTFSQGYFIPNDNPWQDAGGGVLEEFWAVGLRNPYRMSRDAVSGTVLVADVGQTGAEEVDALVRAGNYQWAHREGKLAGPSPAPSTLLGVSQDPLWSYEHRGGDRCVIGGPVYRGAQHAERLAGRYVFGDYVSGKLWAMRWQGVPVPEVTQIASLGGYTLSGFGVDHAGEIFLMALGFEGRIYRLEASATPPPPATLSATGAFADLGSLRPAPGVMAYTVNSPLWSDGAAKRRWIALPGTNAPYAAADRVVFRENAPWDYPVGTVLIKHFELNVDEGDTARLRRLETRFMVKARTGNWYGVTYRWRPDGSDADLLSAGLDETITIRTTSGGTRQQVWNYPSRSACMQCHNAASTQVLGLQTWQLNGPITLPGGTVPVNQLQHWSDAGLLDRSLSAAQIAALPQAVDPLAETGADRATRVRSYLDANCASCHRPGGAQAFFDARFSTPLAQQGLILGPLASSQGLSGAHVVTPGSLELSMLYRRLSSEGADRMPPVGRNVAHRAGLAVIETWIKSLASPAAPLGLTARATGPSRVELAWSAGSANETRFVLQRRLAPGAWQALTEIASGERTALDLAVRPGVMLEYRVAAANEAGQSAWSNVATATTWSTARTWQEWQALFPLGGRNGAMQDFDEDGQANLLEFALGLPPETGVAAMEPPRFRVEPSIEGSGYDAVLTRPAGLSGLTYTLLVAPRLERPMAWQEAAGAVTVTSLNGLEELRLRRVDLLPQLSGAGGRGVARLRVRLDATGETVQTAAWFWARRLIEPGVRSFAPAVLKPERFAGVVGSANGLEAEVSGSAGVGSVKQALDLAGECYVEVVAGSGGGDRYEVDSAASTETQLVVKRDDQRNTRWPPALTQTRLVVRPHWTLGELFPPARLTGGLSATVADRVSFFDLLTGGWKSCWLFAPAGQEPRWVAQGAATLSSENGRVIAPGVAVLFQRVGSTSVEVPHCGLVREGSFVVTRTLGHQLVGTGWPADLSPLDLGMRLEDGRGFVAATNPALADRFMIWSGDLGGGSGYRSWFLLDAGSRGTYWTEQGTASLANQNDVRWLRSEQGFFLKAAGVRPAWVMPSPWSP